MICKGVISFIEIGQCVMRKDSGVFYNRLYLWTYVGSAWLCSQSCLQEDLCEMGLYKAADNYPGGLCHLYSSELTETSVSGIVYRKHCGEGTSLTLILGFYPSIFTT